MLLAKLIADSSVLGFVFTTSALLANSSAGPTAWALAGTALVTVFIIVSFLADRVKTRRNHQMARPDALLSPFGSGAPSAGSKDPRTILAAIYVLGMLDLGFTLWLSRLTDVDCEWNFAARQFLTRGSLAVAFYKFVLLAIAGAIFLTFSESRVIRGILWFLLFCYAVLMGYWAVLLATMI